MFFESLVFKLFLFNDNNFGCCCCCCSTACDFLFEIDEKLLSFKKFFGNVRIRSDDGNEENRKFKGDRNLEEGNCTTPTRGMHCNPQLGNLQ